ncbi:hypothetical protein SAMN04487916_10926 [Arthrobacter sp. ov407]|uniref:hypothetical protein n=1 Tax=Arthrobacter sp. ov407 TaxID=1761748 RepID=UPI0008902483|nr:hypothetical protein [Arthrobacter sp. ov407]SDL44026.1 hypothetical protein SAMN04487916_10926 [Arthrobacter sp. ov407]
MPLFAALPRPPHQAERPAGGTAAGDSLPRTSIAVAALSTIVEWYDFTLYLFMATILSRVIFGGGTESLLATLAAFAVSYLCGP